MEKSVPNITAACCKLKGAPKAIRIDSPKTGFKSLAYFIFILLLITCFSGLIRPSKAFASKIQVTAISVGSQNGTATYGTAAPTITYVITLTKGTTGGTQSNDGISIAWTSSPPAGVSAVFSSGANYNPSLFSTITLTISTTNSTQAGSYPFTITNTDFNGGGTKTSSGTLTVGKKALTITGLTASDKVYDGNTTATISGTATLNGVVAGDVVNLVGTPTGTFSSANVGSRTVSVSGYTISGASATNYTLTQPSGLTANISAAPLTITANTQSKTYGTNLTTATGITTFTSSGLITGQTIGSVTITYGTGGAATAAVGTYTGQATPSAATGGTFAASNYSITYIAGDLVVNLATLTITAANVSMTYGSTPSLTANYSGFVNGDTQSSIVSTAPTLTTTGNSTSSVGTYPISVSGAVLSSSNYTITYVSGTLTVSKAALTITADNQYMVQGSAVPTLTATYSGFVNGEGTANLTTQATITTTATSASTPANYPITVSGATAANYTITFVSGILTVLKAEYNWTGAVSTNWTTPQNWSVNGVQQTSLYPGSSGTTDAAQIGVATSFTNLPVVSNTLPNALSVLAFGSMGGASSLNIISGATLNVSGPMVVNSGATVSLPGSGSLSISGAFSSSGNVTFGPGASTFSSTFTISAGNVTFGTGQVTFNSNAGQTKFTMVPNSVLTFVNVLFTNTGHYLFKTGGGASSGFAIASNGVLTIANNTSLVFANTTGLTLYSDASGSASIAQIPSGCNISGTVNVQRFITGNQSNTYRGYRMLSSPVNSTSATSSLNNYISLAYLNASTTFGGVTYNGALTGGPGTGFSLALGNPTVFLYDERRAVDNTRFASGKHVGVYSITGSIVSTFTNLGGTMVITPNVSIPVGNGYLLYFVGPNTRTNGSTLTPPDNATLTASGYLNQQDVTVNLWYSPTGGSAGQLSYTASLGTSSDAGFNMVGNPYACSIDLSKVITDNSAAIDNIYILDPTGPTQAYQAYTANGTSYPGIGYAVSGAGFIVHATGTGQALTFHESEKVTSPALTGVLMSTSVQEQPLTGLYMKLEQDSIHYDYCGIYFRNDWSDKFEPGDALDLNAAANQINIASLSSDGVRASVNHLPSYTNDNRVRLYTNVQTSGTYTLKIEGIRNMDIAYDIYLVDRYKQDSVNIRKSGAYAFSILKSDTASFGANRFVLAIHRNPAYIYQLLNFTAEQVAHSSHVLLTWKTQNEQNNNFTVERSNDGGNTFAVVGGLPGTGAGTYALTDKNAMAGQNLYRLKSEDINNNATYSQIVEVMISDNGNADRIHLYPNPTASIVNMDVLDKTNGNISYNITVSNSTGFIVKQVTSSQPKWQADLSTLLPGTYLIRVTNNKTQDFIGESKLIKL